MNKAQAISGNAPLADRLRPVSLAEFAGQKHILGADSLLYQAIESGESPSLIFWGPPGSGKTTLARLVALRTSAEFRSLSAVTSGKKDLVETIAAAEESLARGQRTILFIDEIHRWNKAQQDALLPHVERGIITLIGATTENPSFELRSALLSRCRLFVLERLSEDDIAAIVDRALLSPLGLAGSSFSLDEEAKKLLCGLANGDARTALNALEYLARRPGRADAAAVKAAFQKPSLFHDKDGEEHYNIISALHKALRGSDADAGLYWLARLIEGGEDPLYIARRLIRFASEDIGLANSRALEQAAAAFTACRYIGLPECSVVLAQAVVYLAKCEKSNELYEAYGLAAADARQYGNLPVPIHLRNAPTKMMKDLGYGRGYKYSPEHGYREEQEYFPDKLKKRRYLKK